MSEKTNKKPKGKFVWGEIVKDHELGEYLIREYIEKNGETAFHVYRNGIDTHTSFECIESAIVGAIARKYDGLNTQADLYFIRAIDMLKKYE